MKKVIAWGLLTVAGVLAAVFALSGRTGATATGDRFLSGEASVSGVPGGEVIRVTRRDVGSIVKATGVIKPMIGAQVRVGSRISGVVRRLYVKVGDSVEKGQLLAELEERELVARRNEAAAALSLSKANLSYASTDLRRKREIATAKLISVTDLDLAEREYAVSEQRQTQAQANLEYANTQLDYSRIFAPIAGVVASVSTQEGETVTAGLSTPTFVTLLDLSRLEVWAYVDETDIGRIASGLNARFTVDTYGDQEFEGKVNAIYPQAEIRDNVVNYIAVVRFETPHDRTLRAEMTTTVRIALERHDRVLALPLRAVKREGSRRFVLLAKGGVAERRSIATGIRDDSYWEITGGLQEGDQVVVADIEAAH